MEMSSIIEQMLIILILLLLGVLLRKTGVTDNAANEKLNKVVLNFSQIGMILASVMNVDPVLKGMELVWLIVVSCITHAVLGVIGVLAALALRTKKDDRGVYIFMTIFGNVGFMGFPVVSAIFGKEAVFYASLFNIPFNVLVYSLGIMLIAGGGERRFSFRRLINAPLIATLVALLIFILRVPIPSVIQRTTDMVGSTVVPLSMVIIGGSLGDVSLREVFGDWRSYAFLPIRLLICPIAVWALLRLFVTNELILGICTVLAGMPVAALSTMLCIQHKGNVQLAARSVFLSTIVSVVTIPLVVYLLLL